MYHVIFYYWRLIVRNLKQELRKLARQDKDKVVILGKEKRSRRKNPPSLSMVEGDEEDENDLKPRSVEAVKCKAFRLKK